MWKTVIFLIFTLLVIPVAAYYTDVPPTDFQWELLRSVFRIYLPIAGLCFILSSLVKNYSQVDKLWSTLPIVYVWVVAFQTSFEPRILLMAILVSLWGIRLTYNFARRGGYSWRFWEGEEDYRWAVLQARPEFQGTGRWMLFNLFFISFYQLGLILLFTFPIIKSAGGGALGIWDLILAGLFLALLVMETVADQQQWNFQKEKYRLLNDKKPLGEYYGKGFTHTGLWAYMRHPNYTAEQSIWIVFYLFSVVASGYWFNWSVAGCILLILLFYGSSNFSEDISASKYPAYKEYQKKVGRFIPKW